MIDMNLRFSKGIAELKEGQKKHGEDIAELKVGQAELKNGYTELKNGQAELKQDLTELKHGHAELENGLAETNGILAEATSDIVTIKTTQILQDKKLDWIMGNRQADNLRASFGYNRINKLEKRVAKLEKSR